MDSRLFIYDLKDADSFSQQTGQPELIPTEIDRFIAILEDFSVSDEPRVLFEDFYAESENGGYDCFNVGFICTDPGDRVIVTFTPVTTVNLEDSIDIRDLLTGLYTLPMFRDTLDKYAISEASADNKSLLVYLDIQRFKAINEIFGVTAADSLLKHIGDIIKECVGREGMGCRIGSDRFIFFIPYPGDKTEDFIKDIIKRISDFDLAFEIVCSVGLYVIDDPEVTADGAIDRAVMAQSVIKGSYATRYNFYDDSLREKLLSDQEITSFMRTALAEEQFVIYYQPQYDHSTGVIIGAEALVRWDHSEKGMIPPSAFIPVFERNGFITALDLYVFDKVCAFLRECIDKGLKVVPISTNLTRYDIFNPGFIDELEAARKKYDVPPKYIRVEITESAALGNSRFINDAVRKLHSFGYIVEMDDFGSGYSSLNILKDIDFDIIKLDMNFLEKDQDKRANGRGGTILSSIVRMVSWLGLPLIAEGVETVEQADFLKSIGCNYIQGFLYSKPIQRDEYEKLISQGVTGTAIQQMKLTESLKVYDFWENDSLETLIFNNFVCGAAILDYKDGKIEILRVNKKYLSELGMNLTEAEVVRTDPLDHMSKSDGEMFLAMLDKAIQSGDEEECEVWCSVSSGSCGDERICLRTTVKMIGSSKDNYLFHSMIRNTTAEKKQIMEMLDTEKRFKMASEQVNIYFWEYTIATREMRPCYRCMRDLGLPAVLKNYPDSAIEMGVIAPEAADMYRDWHRQLAEGVPSLEAVIPLTTGKVPFRVRYTNEFDENGRPIKAYGSAALEIEK